MRAPSLRTITILLLALLAAAAAPLVGAWTLGVAVLLLLLLLLPLTPAMSRRLALLAAGVGGIIGVVSAAWALLAVGTTAPYSARAPFGWAALALAVVATTGGPVAQRRPWAGAALMLLAGLAGVAAISLFFIDTPYVLALPAWLVGAALVLRARRPPPTP